PTHRVLCARLRLRPPGSTLFPYTTLFRSLGQQAHRDELRRADAEPAKREREQREAGAGGRERRGGGGCGVSAHGVPGPFGPPARDRKSTRLNSSHVKISYAVFCLKKKTKQ